ncbi:bifunctional [glutamine synthetase] adenylyltransferase/[glutamine synthetase]-adenylyl-L-tyrosine phosphorylase [Caenibius sp. WL]|uniref:bifunctional [glutamine synthetase] adenylyltransferase/[glutamine synthetase]-adenylyl-L-tyrosine phosphorylase n=1 Tax=Caenibius sp. WL TaxID=2872646 RepID=UPI001E6B7E0A|nr:bifunctional [glutamine synthetase] adenylyltransferase/[glutamine synthetase]-adenylyl-L-tyrosine phosphorylase [Caenibius sp. WL]QZP09725.1 bifunctional [glutamine synthetase] adenylyltransferase/[glutamine synthetase]-adenylyl-L-tyrosine phosphorylase [Caenibius sp. WL]
MSADRDADWQGAIARARAYSPFLTLGLDRQPELAALLAAGQVEEALAYTAQAGSGADDPAVALRLERWALATALGIGDLAGSFSLTDVMARLSGFADRALDVAIAAAIRERAPDSDPAGFFAIALGKHGAGELNYSSDIDPILIYDPEALPRRERDEPGEAAQRVARRVVEMLSHMTADGYVFRVDLRLRPASEVSPLAISLGAALTHYESSALAWERAAFIRARSAAGDVPMGEDFLAAIRPFVWRKSLDFGAIEEIGRLIGRIRGHYGGPTVPGPGFDLKRGRGGIREVEFFAQTHQLIHGGRRPSLRQRGTRATLDALAAEGIIAAEDARLLGESYDRLRVVEHRLQMVSDHQVHNLPKDAAAIDGVARLDGLPDGAALLAELADITDTVGRRFDALLEQTGQSAVVGGAAPVAEGAPPALAGQLGHLGFANPEEVAERVLGWTDGRIRALRSDAARAAFAAIEPALLAALASAPDPEAALLRWETFLVKLPTGVNLFRLLEARPGLFEQVVSILTLAPPLAEELVRRPDLLDALIDTTALDLPGTVAELAERMARCDDGGDYQARLDRVRRVVGEVRFALGVQLIEAAHDPLEIAEALARTAEAALHVCADAACEEFAATHGRVSGSSLLVMGLGRFGGGALTHASDLDIVYLFTDGAGGESDGRRPLGATLYFNRLAQRVSAALSVPTAEGALYEVDTRLRPQGAQGPLAVSLESFARYQREDAWTWEHMALARARPLYGSDAGKAQLSEIVRSVLARDRDPAKLKHDVLTMRSEMAAHKQPKGALDAKLARGGLVDVEFLIHYLQLRDHLGFSPDLFGARDALIAARLLPPELAEAHRFMTRLLISSRLLAPDAAMPPPAAAAALARNCGCGDEAELLTRLTEARRCVAGAWHDTFGETLEIDDA